MAVIDDLGAYWSLEEASGTRADAHSTHDLTDSDPSVTSTTGKVGTCAVFGGSGAHLSMASHADVQGGNTTFSMAGWIRPGAISEGYDFFTKWGTGGLEYLCRASSVNTFQFFIDTVGDGSGVANVGATPYSAATWYYYAAGHNATLDELWISIDAATPSVLTGHTGGVHAGTAILSLGSAGGTGGFLVGRMDEWGFWRRDIRSDVSWLYNSGNGRSYQDIVDEAGPPPDPDPVFPMSRRYPMHYRRDVFRSRVV